MYKMKICAIAPGCQASTNISIADSAPPNSSFETTFRLTAPELALADAAG